MASKDPFHFVTLSEINAREEDYERKFLFDVSDSVISPNGIKYIVIARETRWDKYGYFSLYTMKGFRRNNIVVERRFVNEELLIKWVTENSIPIAEVRPYRGDDIPVAPRQLRL